MDALLVVFHLPTSTPSNIHKSFRRKMYGEKTSSWGGRYQYRRQGILDTIPHVWLYWGVIIVRESDYDEIMELLSEYSALVETRILKCNREDIIKLSEDSQ